MMTQPATARTSAERRDPAARAARDRLAELLGVHPRRLARLSADEAWATVARVIVARRNLSLAD